MDFRLLLKVIGGLLICLAGLIAIPGVFAVFNSPGIAEHFLYTTLLCLLIGASLWAALRDHEAELNHRTGFAIVAVSWLLVALLGAVPYYSSGVFETFLDSFFESISGFTGTGATVLTDIEAQPHAILLWRSMTQWIGGMGIIIFFIALLPILGLQGAQLFKAEVTGPQKEKITPRVRETAKRLWILYLSFTIAAAFFLVAAGMNLFDAVNHALTSVSTGGFSTKNVGIAHFQNPIVEYVLILFMFIGAVNFALHYRFLSRKDHSVLFTTEFKCYVGIIALATCAVTFVLWGDSFELFSTAFRNALFTVVGTASSTGFTNNDYVIWPVSIQSILIALMIMGGMSGSTAGGIKCIRLVAAIKQLLRELKQVVHPSAVYTIKVDEHSISPQISNSIWGFIFLYFVVHVLLSILLAFQGLDLLSAATAGFAVLSNIGPAFGSLGPYESYSNLTDTAKVILCAGMLLGRLEFYSVIVLFTFEYWRK